MGDDDSEDSTNLFLQEMEHVKPLKPGNKVSHKPKRKKFNRTKTTESDDVINDNFSDAPVEDAPQRLSFAKTGLQTALLKKLRTGKMPIDAELDLHGMTVNEAREALLYFLAECDELGNRCVLIVHGKGYSSPNNKPIIKAYINRWLRDVASVLAFYSAQAKDGGTGAAYVLLKQK